MRDSNAVVQLPHQSLPSTTCLLRVVDAIGVTGFGVVSIEGESVFEYNSGGELQRFPNLTAARFSDSRRRAV